MRMWFFLFALFVLGNIAALAQAPADNCDMPVAGDDLDLTITPNPATSEVLISWKMKKKGPASVSLLDMNERMQLTIHLDEVPESRFTKSVSVEAFTSGIYCVLVRAQNRVTGKKLVIQHL